MFPCEVILRLSCMVSYSTVEKAESSPRTHAGRWQHGNDQIELTKTAQSSSRPSFRPSSRSRHAPPHASHHQIAHRHDNGRMATPCHTARISTTTHRPDPTPSDTHDRTKTYRATVAARKDETTRENELTKTAHPANASPSRHARRQANRPAPNTAAPTTSTIRPNEQTKRRADRKTERRTKRAKRAEKQNERRDEERNGESGSRGGTKGGTKTIHRTDTKKPQEKHATTSYSAHDTKKMKNGKKQVAGQPTEPIIMDSKI